MQLDDRVRVNSKKEYDGRFYGVNYSRLKS